MAERFKASGRHPRVGKGTRPEDGVLRWTAGSTRYTARSQHPFQAAAVIDSRYRGSAGVKEPHFTRHRVRRVGGGIACNKDQPWFLPGVHAVPRSVQARRDLRFRKIDDE